MKEFITYQECLQIVKKSPYFVEYTTEVDGTPVSIFTYGHMAYSEVFLRPYEGCENDALELRGLVFVHEANGPVVYPLLEKFFNVGQIAELSKEKVVQMPIKSVYDKVDGSVLSYVRVNGKTYARSKTSFGSDQAKAGNRLYTNVPEYREFIDWCLDNDIVPIFEYIAPTNRIVLQYDTEELVLLRMRCRKTGKHIDDLPQDAPSIKRAKRLPINDWDTLYQTIETMENSEGYVVAIDTKDGSDLFVKVKCPWYVTRHGLLTDTIYRPHLIAEIAIKGEMDDFLSIVPDDLADLKEMCRKIWKVLANETAKLLADIRKTVAEHYTGNRKEFAMQFKNTPNFSMYMAHIDGKDMDAHLATVMLNRTKSFELAIKYLTSLDPTVLSALNKDFE